MVDLIKFQLLGIKNKKNIKQNSLEMIISS